MSDIITDAIEFLKKIRSEKEVKIRFIKKDNSVRLIKATLDFNLIPKSKQPKGIDLPKILSLIHKNILHVFDLEKQEWRSINFDSVDYLETTTNQRFYVKK